ncbi:carboxymuconolactone decarboxylase family protein [Vibrio sp. SS-MA-C1-2]|uniref:carboxymuconolactone decarboxylase family protein n=1 Tax=Vibrio sp. SS-MA-C1-2 TaxID=2908646 RepID=UPI001F217965|nr:carboxymuconolactone decarboxylase family protein [Vibrio sp. SS-MA-C1-2]UJF17047.1 carboxymuconolactone decarboxylase family protein [Vibrio sp. SS-MA-C1-2]
MSNVIESRADQVALLKKLLKTDNRAISYAAWAAVFTTGSTYVHDLISNEIETLSKLEKRDVEFAVARMGVTNPYFVARQFVSIGSGGSLEALNFRDFPQLDVQDDVAYHHACVAVSLINGGYVCLRSHVTQLQAAGVPDQDIDTTMRIAAVSHSLKILGTILE